MVNGSERNLFSVTALVLLSDVYSSYLKKSIKAMEEIKDLGMASTKSVSMGWEGTHWLMW
jgi:hypothetical protein